MAATIKTPEEMDKMRIAGKLASDVLVMIEPHVKAGVSTNELNDICHRYITEVQDAIPAPLNYKGYPKSICTSVNNTVCHGVPTDKRLKPGDIVNIDVTVIKDGFHGDTSKMFYVGKVAPFAARLAELTQEGLYLGIEMVKPGVRLGDIGHAIEQFAHKHRYTSVQDYCGHGIGRRFHEDPQVLHFGKPGTGMAIKPGMVFTIEPMFNLGSRHVKTLADKWTVVTKDRRLSAQWEHTIAVTETGHEVLTARPDEPFYQQRT